MISVVIIIITLAPSFVLLLDLPDVGVGAQQLKDAHIVPLLAFVCGELGVYFGAVMVVRIHPILSILRYVDVNICVMATVYP